MRKLKLLAVLAAVALGLTFCASVPPKQTAEDCLVLIRTTLTNNVNAPGPRQYHFKLNMGYGIVNVRQSTEDVMMIVIRQPGVKIIGIGSEVVGNAVYGESEEVPLDLDLPYQRGEVVVADFEFSRVIAKDAEHEFRDEPHLQWISSERKTAVLEKFKKAGGAQSWLQ